MWILFLLNFFITTSEGKSQLCFVLVTSTVRRDSLGVLPAISQLGCNIRCYETPGCDACMFYEEKARCVLLGAARSPPPGRCPQQYTCYERRTSGCPVKTGPLIDRGYTPGACSRLSDVQGPPPMPANKHVCGIPSPTQRRLVLDAILHDGTRLVLENDVSSYVDWDSYMGSWFYHLKGINYYFKNATCVRPPAAPLAPECGCGTIPTEQQILAVRTKHPIAQPRSNTDQGCAKNFPHSSFHTLSRTL